jgi:hypothetical protein
VQIPDSSLTLMLAAPAVKNARAALAPVTARYWSLRFSSEERPRCISRAEHFDRAALVLALKQVVPAIVVYAFFVLAISDTR